MEALFEVISDYYQIILSYPLYYYGFFFLILGAAVIYYIRKKYSTRNRIKIIKSLIKKDPQKALKKISSSRLEVIEYFLTPEKIKSGHFVKITDYFSRPEQLKKIYNKIFSKKHKREYYCQLGINIFSRIKTPQSAEYLITFLYEDNRELVIKAIDALSEFEYDKIIFSFLEILESRPDPEILSKMEKIFKSSRENAQNLLSFAREADAKVKSWCLDIFAEFPEEKFYDIIIEFLDSDNPELKIKSIKKLENFTEARSKDIYSRLLKLLEHDNEKIRAASIKTLKKIHFDKTTDHIAGHLEDESPLVRKVATEALMDMGDKGLKYLLESAKKPKAPTEVIRCLEKQGIPFLINAVEKLNNKQNQQQNHQNLNIS
ncbi:MAG: HEAT repeat domain-containing protein [Halanaerobiaceae bacterium]